MLEHSGFDVVSPGLQFFGDRSEIWTPHERPTLDMLLEGNNALTCAMRLYVDTLDSYWPPERRHIEAGYATLPFPFAERPAPPLFELRCDWTLAQYLAYLSSWSAAQRYLKATGRDAIAEFAPALAQACWLDRSSRLRLKSNARYAVRSAHARPNARTVFSENPNSLI